MPVWIAGPANRRTARRVAEFGAGWIPGPIEPITADLRRGRELIDEAMAAHARDLCAANILAPAPVVSDARGRPSLQRSLELARQYVELGITDLTLSIAPMMAEGSDPMSFLEQVPLICSEHGLPITGPHDPRPT